MPLNSVDIDIHYYTLLYIITKNILLAKNKAYITIFNMPF